MRTARQRKQEVERTIQELIDETKDMNEAAMECDSDETYSVTILLTTFKEIEIKGESDKSIEQDVYSTIDQLGGVLSLAAMSMADIMLQATTPAVPYFLMNVLIADFMKKSGYVSQVQSEALIEQFVDGRLDVVKEEEEGGEENGDFER